MSTQHVLFKTIEFKDNYNTYIHNNPKTDLFVNFLKTISIDKFENIKSVRSTNKPKLKKSTNINSFLNKISYNNIDTVTEKIHIFITDNHETNIFSNVINNILDYCILQYNYSTLYIDLLIKIFDNSKYDYDYHNDITKFINTYKLPTFDTNSSDLYEGNIKLNKLLGYSALIAALESKNIVLEVENTYNIMISKYIDNANIDIKYRYIQSIHIMMKVLYDDNTLPDKYLNPLNKCLLTETYPKSKYKMLDIIERK
jgi:hypothetical protein